MKQQWLNTNWKMRNVKDSSFIPAAIPGSVYKDLLDNGKMENPFWKDNEKIAMELMKNDYEYVTSFTVDPMISKCQKIELVFEGIDTISDVYLNGTFIGSTHNMHRVWKFDIKRLLVNGDNNLRVLLHSPINYIREEYKKCQADGSEEAMVGFPHIRKAHYMFGWDWGPHLPDAGIWRNVKLLGTEKAKIDSVYIKQVHAAEQVTLKFEVEETLYEEAATTYDVEIIAPDGEKKTYNHSPLEIQIERPKLWWPNGYGEQHLYTTTVIQRVDGIETDRWERRIGLRTMTMHIEDDSWGTCFAHQVNGIDCFAMGADYIPEDNLIGRVTKESTYQLLLQCKQAHFNTIRVWGGGYYPNDWFYDICDELGFIVWQDFMFACAVYELTDSFEENIVHEIEENIKRIRHHACLGLWCGNNEMEMFVNGGLWVTRPSQKADYTKMYEYVIPKIVKKLDPETFYWPASPSSGGAFDAPNDYTRGDVHYWDVWHNNVPFSEFRKYHFRYLSEFGFQSFPSLKTIETFTDDPKDLNIFSYIMEKHQRNTSANGKIMSYLQQTFLYPSDFKTLIYASQLLQAEAIRYGVEHFRRNRGRCMGAVYWQLNDCWPVTSWSSIDYCGRWKALHYYAKRFFAPLMISCAEEGMITQNTNVNTEAFDIEKSIQLSVANETRKAEEVEVRWALRSNSGTIIREGKQHVTVPMLSSQWLEKVYFNDADIFNHYVSYALYVNDESISSGTVIFSLPKYFNYLDPELSYEVFGDEIIVTAKTYAKSVEIQNKEDNLKLSDNYFDMNAGSKTIKILEGKPDEIRLRSVYDIR